MQYQPSGSLLQTKTVQISSAQILSIFTTPVVLVPPPGPNMALILNGVLIEYVFEGTPYADGGGHLIAKYGGATQVTLTVGLTTGANFWTTNANAFGYLPCTAFGGVPSNRVANVPLVLAQDAANPTAGNGILIATVTFSVSPVV